MHRATKPSSTDASPVQAFRAGSALGLQFHPELDAGMLDLWLSTPDMVGELAEDEIEEIRAAGARHLPGLVPAAEKVFAGFGELVRARG